jgi:ABC-type molybdate transport system substrate-binding protein
MRYLLSCAVIALAAAGPTRAGAVELTLIAPGGIRAAIQQMLPEFERKTGNTVKATFGSGGGTKAQVVKGDAFDVPVRVVVAR